MHEGTTTEMLVRAEGASGRSAVPVSLRTEPLLETHNGLLEGGKSKWDRTAWRRKYEKKNHAILLQKRRAWRSKNKLRIRAYDAARRLKKRSYYRLIGKRYRERISPATLAAQRRRVAEWKRKQARALSDYYIRNHLSLKSFIHPTQWPKPLLEAVRANIKLKRLWHNQKTSTNSAINS